MWDARCLVLGVAGLVVLVTLTLVLVLTDAGSAAVGAGSAAVVLVAAASYVALRRRYLAWGYAERAEDLLVRRGVLVRRLSVVPYGRMQFVDVTAGPVDRRRGLAGVTLPTAAAASDASIPGLPEEEARRLRYRLAALGEARAAGL